LYRRIVSWAAGTLIGVMEDTGPLAGIAWDQEVWFAKERDGRRSCCIAGAASLLAGAKPTSAVRPDGWSAAVQFTGVMMPGHPWAVAVTGPAAQFLRLEAEEALLLFDPGRTLAELTAMTAVLDAGGRISRRHLNGTDWAAGGQSAWTTYAPVRAQW
jgi:hypothetical protein